MRCAQNYVAIVTTTFALAGALIPVWTPWSNRFDCSSPNRHDSGKHATF